MKLYAPKYRPADSFNVPKGWKLVERGSLVDCAPLRTDLPRGHRPFGVIGYDRELSPAEVENYELVLV